jgi:tellurite resistance protein TehA-like permease
MINFIHQNMALVLAPVMTALVIACYNLVSLLIRHHHTMLHDLHRVIGAVVLFVAFYGIIRYMQSLPEDDS